MISMLVAHYEIQLAPGWSSGDIELKAGMTLGYVLLDCV